MCILAKNIISLAFINLEVIVCGRDLLCSSRCAFEMLVDIIRAFAIGHVIIEGGFGSVRFLWKSWLDCGT
jgi:hypothetical protein